MYKIVQFYRNLHIHIRVLIMNKSIKIITVLALVPLNLAVSTDGEKNESSSGKRSLSNTMITLPKRTGPAGDIPLNPFYMLCCPSLNAQLFARTLLANGFDTTNITIDESRDQYRIYLQNLINNAGLDSVSLSSEINRIIPIFNDMYSGIIEPLIRCVEEDVSEEENDSK